MSEGVKQLLTVILALLQVYYFLVIIRIMSTWIRVQIPEGITKFFNMAIDPFLNVFRVSWLRIGMMDFSPIAALISLSVVTQIISGLARSGTISLGLIFAIILQGLWSVFSFFIWMLLILCLIRLVSFYMKNQEGQGYQILFQLDNFLYRVTSWVLGLFTKESIEYKKALIYTSIALFVVAIGGKWLMNYLINLLYTSSI